MMIVVLQKCQDLQESTIACLGFASTRSTTLQIMT